MTRWLAVTAALAALAFISPAFAADLSPVKAGPPAAPVKYNWTGCYLGVEGGGNWGRSQHTAVGVPNPATLGVPITGEFDLNGALLGGTVGCNYQIDAWVIGIENDLSWTNKSGTATDIVPFNPAARSGTREAWIDTLRGRIGFAVDRALLYGTGGVAFADVRARVCAPTLCVSDSQSQTGWVAGAGIEYAAWDNVSLKLEYLHADFGTDRFINAPVPTPAGGTIVPRDVRVTDHIVRAGVNWRFNWTPVVAKY